MKCPKACLYMWQSGSKRPPGCHFHRKRPGWFPDKEQEEEQEEEAHVSGRLRGKFTPHMVLIGGCGGQHMVICSQLSRSPITGQTGKGQEKHDLANNTTTPPTTATEIFVCGSLFSSFYSLTCSESPSQCDRSAPLNSLRGASPF
ncbi:unnamed protein product [Pleuronectes platessa]|uniref:Uncharacterized protein n=1 Tax=Pleuronectes platessa TaxID=8262 RepID=A0A9N7TW44_PLEPL|nr:unnamed protein product [Pleuronectes platessa]